MIFDLENKRKLGVECRYQPLRRQQMSKWANSTQRTNTQQTKERQKVMKIHRNVIRRLEHSTESEVDKDQTTF